MAKHGSQHIIWSKNLAVNLWLNTGLSILYGTNLAVNLRLSCALYNKKIILIYIFTEKDFG